MSIQDSLFFPSVGTIAMVYSTIQQIFILNKARYAVKNFKHPVRVFIYVDFFFYVFYDRRDDFIVTEFVDSYGVVVYLI